MANNNAQIVHHSCFYNLKGAIVHSIESSNEVKRHVV